MANKFPLILNTSANQIQEIASGDNLDLTGCKIVGLQGINSAGIVTFTKAHVGAATTWGEDLVVTGNARVTGILTVGTNSVTISGNDVNITGVTTASNFKTGTSNLHNVGIELAGINVLGADTPIGTGATIYNSGAAVFTGIVTASNYVGTINTPAQPNITSVGTLSSLNVSGNVSIGGTLTYEDVTNIDAVGLITARNGIIVSAASTFAGLVDINNSVNISSGLVVTSGATLDSAQVSDLTDNRVVIAGASGELEDSADLTFDGTTLAIDAIIDSNDATQSSSSATGSLQVAGGAGIAKNLFVGGGAEITGITTVTGVLDANSNVDIAGDVDIDDTSQNQINATTGALVVDGGVGIAKNLYVGGGVKVGAAFTIGTGIGVTTMLDDDAFNNASATALASQQSIKAYVDTQITAEDLDFSGDSGTGAVDLDSQTLAISGTASEIKTVASGQSLTISLPDDVIVGNGFTVTGIGSFYNDVKFAGSSGATALTWDKSTDDLIFEDDAKAIFGTSSDGLEIYHDGSNSYIDDSGTGNLYLRGSASIELRKAGSTEKMLYAEPDAQVELYWNDSKKLETTGSGVIVTGIATATTFSVGDGSHSTDRISIGDSNDLALYHNASNSFIVDRGTGPLYIRGNTAVRIESYTNDAAGEPMIIANSDSSVDIYYDNVVKFSTSGVGATVYGTGALNIPVGTTAERPTLGNSPVNGDIRYNTTLNSYEGYGNGAWGGLGGGTEIDNVIATTTATGISTFVKTDYRSAYFRLQITQGSAYQVGRYLLIHDGTTATLIEESAIATGSMLGSVTAAVVSSNVIISINMASSSSATITHIIDKITV